MKCPDCKEDTIKYEGAGNFLCARCETVFDRAFLAPAPELNTANPLATQEGGGHYKDMAIQPVEYIHANGLGFIEGCVVKYVSRYRDKNGLEDLKKARHFIDLLISLEYSDEKN